MLTSYRHLEAYARNVIESLLPRAAERDLCLNLLADSIFIAHQSRPSSWGVTLFSNLVRLNVGMIETVVISEDYLYLILDFPITDHSILTAPHVEVLVNPTDIHRGLYLSVPESIGCKFPTHLLSKIKPIIWPAHEELLKNESATRRHPMTRNAHSPGMTSYLRTELKRSIPEPVYPPIQNKYKLKRQIVPRH